MPLFESLNPRLERLGDRLDPGGSRQRTPTAYQLAVEVEPLLHECRDERERAFCRALRVVAVVPREIARQAKGFTEQPTSGATLRPCPRGPRCGDPAAQSPPR